MAEEGRFQGRPRALTSVRAAGVAAQGASTLGSMQELRRCPLSSASPLSR